MSFTGTGNISFNFIKESPELALSRVFRFPSFRPGQKEVIDAIISGKDAFLIMPTGQGKSLVFQIPAICMSGTALVISPLIALMKDQVDALKSRGVRAEFINSSISQKEVSERIGAMAAGAYDLLYVAPERVNSSQFMKVLPFSNISLVAVDEAHCISKWGHDFRPAYRRIPSMLKSISRRVPIVAVTATATPIVREDIVSLLGMNNPIEKITGFSRPELKLSVQMVDSAQKSVRNWVVNSKSIYGKEFPSSIVYMGTKRDVESITSSIKMEGVSAEFYHGGMASKDREIVQNSFMGGEIPIVVATNAFGMGVDKPDIRYIIHGTMPGSVEAYYQEVGRAGRDGNDSWCNMYVDYGGIRLQEWFLNTSHPSSNVAKKTYDTLMEVFENKGPNIKCTYVKLAEMVQGKYRSRFDEKEISQALTIFKKQGVFSAPKKGIMSAQEHDLPYFEMFDKSRLEARERLQTMIEFTKSKDHHKSILEYFGAES